MTSEAVMTDLKVDLASDGAAWDAYVRQAAGASNYHRWVWRKVIEETFGHRGYYLMATIGSRVCGVLPLIHMQSRLFGQFLVSMPFFSYGGVLADGREACGKLLGSAAQLATRLGARHIELRQGAALDAGWCEATEKVTMVLTLPESVEDLWKGLSSGMRNKIRSARKQGLRTEWRGLENVDTLYHIFAVNMRNLGTPVYPRLWFRNLCRSLPEENRILTVWDGEQAVAAGIITTFRDTVEWPWSASLAEWHRKHSAILLYWALLEWALEHGYRRVDLGRCTKGGGVYEFKRHWGAEEIPLHWYYWLAPGVALPALRPDNPRYRLAASLWKRLPLALANAVGPRIVRGIP